MEEDVLHYQSHSSSTNSMPNSQLLKDRITTALEISYTHTSCNDNGQDQRDHVCGSGIHQHRSFSLPLPLPLPLPHVCMHISDFLGFNIFLKFSNDGVITSGSPEIRRMISTILPFQVGEDQARSQIESRPRRSWLISRHGENKHSHNLISGVVRNQKL